MLAAAVLYVIASGQPGFDADGRIRLEWLRRSLARAVTPWRRALIAEVVLTFMFLMIILGATDERAPKGFAPIAIGLGLALANIVGIPVTNASVNPARSTGPALIVGGWAIEQLWLFWLAPIAGAALAGLVYPVLARSEVSTPVQTTRLAA